MLQRIKRYDAYSLDRHHGDPTCMNDGAAIIERVKRAPGGLQRLEVAVSAEQAGIAPGQLLLARTSDTLDPLLRDPWIPIRRDGTILTIERPDVKQFIPGQEVSLLGPIGRAIPVPEATRQLLLIAHDAAPTALLYLAHEMLEKRAAVTLILTGSATRYGLVDLPPSLEVFRYPETEQWTDRAALLKWAGQIVVLAAYPHQQDIYGRLNSEIRQARMDFPPNFAHALYYPPMPCGVGACQACMVKVKGEDQLACTDGPSFDLGTAVR